MYDVEDVYEKVKLESISHNFCFNYSHIVIFHTELTADKMSIGDNCIFRYKYAKWSVTALLE